MTELRAVRELVDFYIGGGWGSDTPSEGHEEVAIIRGADFPRVATGDASAVPVRWEESKKVARRTLREGDLVLEISGGTKERPTGRSIFISQRILQAHRVPVIPASFCRLVRPDPTQVVPRYLYYWLQDMYRDGRTWGYQVQSTGLANFNIEWFLDRELVRVPSLDEQRRIAKVLGALDDLIDTNERLIQRHQSLVDLALIRERKEGDGVEVRLSSIAEFENKKRVPLSAAQRASMPGPFPYYGANGQIDSVGDFIFDQPRLLVGEDGTVMNEQGQAVTRLVWGNYWVNNHAHVLRGAAGVSTAVLRVLLRNLNVRERVTGAVQPKLSMGNLKAATVFLPASSAFGSVVDALTDAEMSVSDENEQLRRTRDELLPLLMSGAVRVRPEGVAA